MPSDPLGWVIVLGVALIVTVFIGGSLILGLLARRRRSS